MKWMINTKVFSIDSKTVKMTAIYFIVCGEYKKIKNPKISCIFEETLIFSVVWGKCGNIDEKIFKEEWIEILKTLGLIDYIEKCQKDKYNYRKHKSRTEIKRNEWKIKRLKEIKQNQLIRTKQKKMQDNKLYRAFTYFIFCSYWMRLNFWFCFICWYFCR